ncbi:MAG: GtrA family protein [Muribaculaceae bacterium]|nr:GtrA family protein [Muribaculaceae bacterium]
MKMRNEEIERFVKYCLVGVLNTLVTLGVIFITKSILDWNPYFCNALGYVAGVTNSFLWNKNWVFHSTGGYRSEGFRFLCGFGVCYLLQLAVVFALNSTSFGDIEIDCVWFVVSGYGLATLAGNVVYTVANFIYNRLITFKQS